MKNLDNISFATIALGLASLTSNNAFSQTGFDIQGLTVGMTAEEFIDAARPLSANGEVNEQKMLIVTPQGIELEETVHLARLSMAGADGGSYTASVTRMPLEEKLYNIRRQIQYGTAQDDPRGLTSFELYEESLIEKYGEPGNKKIGNLGSRMQVQYSFYESEPAENCPTSARATSASKVADIELCPAVLDVELWYLNQPNQPVTNAEFVMVDHSLMMLDNETYYSYWDKWLEDFLASQESGSKPEL